MRRPILGIIGVVAAIATASACGSSSPASTPGTDSAGNSPGPIATPSTVRTTNPSIAFSRGQMQGRSSVTQSNPSFFCQGGAGQYLRAGDTVAYESFMQGCLSG